jgi:hypothetical protein
MAVTITTNTVSSPWTPAQLLAGVKQAFVDSGEITDWRDTYTGGSRTMGILRKTYNAGTYGTTDYGISVFQRVTTNPYEYLLTITAFREWDTGTNAPVGTSGRDFPEDWQLTATAQDYGDMPLNATERGDVSIDGGGKFEFNTEADVTFTCIKSGASGRTDFRWYVIQQGNRYSNFQIANTRTEAACGGLSFGFDRSFPGGIVRGQDVNTSFTDNQYHTHSQAVYKCPAGPTTSVSLNGVNSFTQGNQIMFPVTGFWGYDILGVKNPIIMGGPYSYFHDTITFPEDFGVACLNHLAENAGQVNPLDKLVNVGGEEYVIISGEQPAVSSTSGNDMRGLAFIARTN